MTYTQQLRELLNELKLAKGKNCLIFAISERPARLKELIESNGFDVREISLKGKENLLEMLLTWDETTENTIYFVHGIANQFPWVLPYINLHRDLFFDIKRPVVVVGSEYEVTEIQKHAPDWFRFRSRTYELKAVELGEERAITRFAEPAKPKPVYYSLPVFDEEEGEEEIKERIKIDEYLLSSEHDDYKLAELYMSLSLSLFKLRDFELAEEYLQKSTAIRKKLKDNRGILLNYARLSSIFVGLGEFEKVIEVCSEALKIDPNSVHAYIYRGNAYALFNLHDRAIEDYGKAIELNPNFAATYYNRGTTYLNLKQYESAIEDYGKAIELNPNFAGAYNNRGATYVNLKQYDRAIEDYGKAIELNPNDAGAYNNRGAAYALLSQHDREIADYNKAIVLNPNFAEAYRNRGKAHSEIGRYEESARDLKEAGILFFDSGNEEDSIKSFSSCFDLRPKIENEDVIYSGLALFIITLNPDVIIALKRMRIEDETLRKIFELTLMKLGDEDISEGIAMLEKKEQTGEKKILFELLKKL